MENFATYNLTVLIDDENDIKSLASIIEKHGGSDIKMGQAVKTKLAYPIDDKNIVFMVVGTFVIAPEDVNQLRKSLETEDYILRHIILRVNITNTDINEKTLVKPRVAQTTSHKKEAGERGGMVTNEALEQKIEEILK